MNGGPHASLVSLVVGGLLWARTGLDGAGRTVLDKGLFSYQAPAGWTVTELNLSHPVSKGPLQEGFAPNIQVDIVASALPLAQFIADNLRAARSAPEFRLVSEGPFATDAGLDGTRVVVTERVGTVRLLQTFYFFDGGNDQKLVVSASCAAQAAAADEPLFDASLKTFSLE